MVSRHIQAWYGRQLGTLVSGSLAKAGMGGEKGGGRCPCTWSCVLAWKLCRKSCEPEELVCWQTMGITCVFLLQSRRYDSRTTIFSPEGKVQIILRFSQHLSVVPDGLGVVVVPDLFL